MSTCHVFQCSAVSTRQAKPIGRLRRSCHVNSQRNSEELHTSRRVALASTVVVPAQWLVPLGADAATFAPGGFALQWPGFGKVQPGAVRLPRKQLNLNFAVLLMRSTYEVADSLDFIAMDQFQIRFFKLRQAEFEPYKLLMDPLQVPVGNLASPLYFDFISFVQYATLAKAMPDAPQVFEEFCEDCEGEALARPYRIVRRDPALADNKKLPERLQRRVGRAVLGYMQNGFRDEQFGCPAALPATATLQEVAVAVQQLLDVFVRCGFAISARVENIEALKGGNAGSWTVAVQGGANLWGLQTLQFRNAALANAYDAFAIQAYLEQSGWEGAFEIEADSTAVEHRWTVEKAR